MATIETLILWPESALRATLVGAGTLAAWLDERLEKRRSRRLLLEMTDYQLRDIGITRGEALHEGRRPFWD